MIPMLTRIHTSAVFNTLARAIKSKVERGYGADRYDQKKVRHYHKIMDEKELHLSLIHI